MVKQEEQLDKAYDSYPESVELSFTFRKLSESGNLANLNRMQSHLERAYTHAFRDLLRLQQLRESKKHGAERTQSQERTPAEPRASASDSFPLGTPPNPSPPAQYDRKPPAPPQAPSPQPRAPSPVIPTEPL